MSDWTVDIYYTLHKELKGKLRDIPRGKIELDEVIEKIVWYKKWGIRKALLTAFKKLEEIKNDN